ncbi:MAG: DUF5681 domain-containing protein [Erythrobacter sp.]
MSSEYDVGYKKPPKQHQWEKGESGNPLGGSNKQRKHDVLKSFEDVLIDELLVTIEPTVGGKKQKMRIFRAIIKSTVRDAMTGSSRDRREFIKMIDRFVGLDRLGFLASERGADKPLSPAEKKLISKIIEDARNEYGEPPTVVSDYVASDQEIETFLGRSTNDASSNND